MPAANVEVVRRYYDLLNAGDMDGCADLLADDFQLVEPSLPDAGVHHGLGGMRRWYGAMQDAWTELHWEPEEFIEVGDWVVTRVRFSSRGSHTAIRQGALRFQTMGVEDGRLAFATGYGDLAKAMEAVGRGSDA